MGSGLLPWVLLAYLLIGAGVGASMWRRGHPAAQAAAALVAWPLLVGPAEGAEGLPTGKGPHAARIIAAFAALRASLAEPSGQDLIPAAEVQGMERSLLAADARIGLVDRLLSDPEIAASAQPLQIARARAAQEIEASLREVIQLRIQIGLVALAGDTAPVRSRVQSLAARVRALSEMNSEMNSAEEKITA